MTESLAGHTEDNPAHASPRAQPLSMRHPRPCRVLKSVEESWNRGMCSTPYIHTSSSPTPEKATGRRREAPLPAHSVSTQQKELQGGAAAHAPQALGLTTLSVPLTSQ